MGFRRSVVLALLFWVGFASPAAIVTPRLTIDRFTAADTPWLVSLIQEEKVIASTNTQATHAQILELAQEILGEQGRVGFVARRTATGDRVGILYFSEDFPGAYWGTTTVLDPAYWSEGLGTEARAALTEYVFKELRWPGLTSEIFHSNERSRRLAERLGFRETARMEARDASVAAGEWIEYRLARATALDEKLADTALRTLPQTAAQLAQLWRHHRSVRSRVRPIYDALMHDRYFRRQVAPEHLSVFAESLATNGVSLAEVFLQTRWADEPTLLPAQLAKAYLAFTAPQIEAVHATELSQRRRRTYQVAVTVNGARHTLGSVAIEEKVPKTAAAIVAIVERKVLSSWWARCAAWMARR